jgi:hypothetical protein
MKTFLTTFRSFTTPAILLKKLVERFRVPQNKDEDIVTIHLRICNVLKHWVENYYEDFSASDALQKVVEDFLKQIEDLGKYQQYVVSIRTVLSRV